MPVQPHPISGIILDIDNSTPLEGATVKVYDREKSASVTVIELTDSNGIYILDVTNIKNESGIGVDYDPGDNIVIEATKGDKIVQEKTTIIGDAQTVNLTIAYNDALGVMIGLLNDNWQKERTDNIKPTIGKIFEYKELDFENNDYVLVYETSEIDGAWGIGGESFKEFTTVSMDTRTTKKRAAIADVRPHLFKMREEIKRIVKSKIAKPARPFQLLEQKAAKDLSDKFTGIGRCVIDIELRYWGS